MAKEKSAEISLTEAGNEANNGLLASFPTKSSGISVIFTRHPSRAKVSLVLKIHLSVICYYHHMTILYYIHDPMCSWCWAFAPTWKKIQKQLPTNIKIDNLLGGLAPDNNEPMPKALQNQIAGYWETIEQKVPGTRFNYNFWKECSPKRSTYPACRAVIATKKQKPNAENEIINAIQTAYYLNAQNPSDLNTLISLAGTIGLNAEQFKADINSDKIHNQLSQEIEFSQQIGARGFPSLVLEHKKQYHFIPLDYNDEVIVLKAIEKLIS